MRMTVAFDDWDVVLKPVDPREGMTSAADNMAVGATLHRLTPVAQARPWGRVTPDAWGCGLDFSPCIGEVHHLFPETGQHLARPAGSDRLLLKTLYAEAPLSVQVHPDAATTVRLGLGGPGQAASKDEAWYILSARPGAVVGLGLREAMTEAAFREAVLDGSIVEALIWQVVKPGDALMVPAGTVHAIGAGVTMFEVQQNLDVTLRLHDHGRGRRLDVEAGLQVASREAWVAPLPAASAGPGRETLVSGGGFVMERVRVPGQLCPMPGRPAWVAVIEGEAILASEVVSQGYVALVHGPVAVEGDAVLLLAQAGALPQPGLWQPG